ncbi:MAG: hypothetical protein ABSC76_20000 [Terracidiphilus sp.]|jgi:hypothetical protein
MKWICLIAVIASGVMGLTTGATDAPSPWVQPAATLAEEIAGILGPGQAHLTIRNLSTIPSEEIPAILRLLEQDLKARGVTTSEAESANVLRVTLSENLRERLWVAEIVEGNETRVAMVHVDRSISHVKPVNEQIQLRKQTVFAAPELSPGEPILYAIEKDSALLLLHPEGISVLNRVSDGWQRQSLLSFSTQHSLSRDARGLLIPSVNGVTAFIPGLQCSIEFAPAEIVAQGVSGAWSYHCHTSDDPWPIARTGTVNDSASLKAFYNSARNYFTGVVTPSLGVDLPPFYSAALLPRPSGAAFLFSGIDGKVQVVENGALKPVSGTRDWGSDFAALNSGCGAGMQVIASGSGEATADSLRVYELPAQEAVPASAPLAMDGSVTALWSAPDGKSIFAVVRKTTGAGSEDSYEVDRVTASCNE